MLSYLRIKLKPKEEDRLLAGHPWVFANEVEGTPKHLTPGCLVEVVTAQGAPVGRGVANPVSKIMVRLLTYGFEQDIDEAFIAHRVEKAVEARQALKDMYQTNGLRLIFGEADGLPGLIADAFGDTVVLSCFSAGLKNFLPIVTQTLQKNGYPFVYEKTVGETCAKEGMEEHQGWLTEPRDLPLELKEGEARFLTRPDAGQKTGCYLDIREARTRLFQMSRGKKILDAFCYTGFASVQAVLGGALEVLAADSSQTALDDAAQNAKLNGVEGKIRFEKADTFKAMREWKKQGLTFDGVFLDPPPLAKSVHDLPEARSALKRMVSHSIDLLNPGGFLIVATCSHHFSWTLLEGLAREAVEQSGRSFQLTERLTQPLDHPIILSVPETEYLRALVLREVSF